MHITSVTLKGFRCFEEKKLTFNSAIALVEGENGSGKSSILEALHYACYLRSFRTHLPKELVGFAAEGFSIKLEGYSEDHGLREPWTVQVGLADKKRKVQVNGKVVNSYKQLLATYRVITVTEDDLMLIKGSPDQRRSFMDQALFLSDTGHVEVLRRYRKVLKQRNALLSRGFCDKTSYDIWTEQLDELTQIIQEARIGFLGKLETVANQLITNHFKQAALITLSYKPKKKTDQLFEKETLFKRSLFGAHLDDCSILYHDKQSKRYASRGQQKLVAIVLKIAQLQLLGKPAIFLIDDFMTDFDEHKIHSFLELFKQLKSQLIITTPVHHGILQEQLEPYSPQIVNLAGLLLKTPSLPTKTPPTQ